MPELHATLFVHDRPESFRSVILPKLASTICSRLDRLVDAAGSPLLEHTDWVQAVFSLSWDGKDFSEAGCRRLLASRGRIEAPARTPQQCVPYLNRCRCPLFLVGRVLSTTASVWVVSLAHDNPTAVTPGCSSVIARA
ncbi:hypothetical protein ColLi_09123 [Colletotrichum liriopes]|uniref:Uncharacterized protein n=1 Tax=Colletotrichum liriopes TaxID=708192 RepID=A0AA37GSC5_9PEZI|nr:hypothetical protein ColLi_09123 [Colletotrichum liriopes]